jgi:hypothetical protein
MLTGALGRGRIAVWYRSLSREERSEHARKAGKQRWKNATGYDHLRVREQLRRYRLSREEAMRRLKKAQIILAERRRAADKSRSFLKEWLKRTK